MTSAAENDSMRLDADLHFAADVKSLYPKFTVEAGEKIDGHDTYLVEGHAEGRPPLRLYLDEQSGLLLRMVRYVQSPLGLNPTEVDYADYREADGVKVPFRWTVARPGNRFTIQVENVQQNTSIDDSRFTPPPPPPPPPAASAPPAKP
jgi:outer membrane lipoprotein-sorting protein